MFFRNRISRQALGLILAFCLTSIPGAFAATRELVPMGCTVGIEMRVDGVLVVGLTEIETESGTVSPAADAGIMPGDLIISLAGRNLKSAQDFIAVLAELDGNEVILKLRRGGETLERRVTPIPGGAHGYQLGLWLRDSVAGIGTVTFFDPASGMYGALGHPINDLDTGMILPLGGGTILDSTVVDVRRGAVGKPGELCGSFDPRTEVGSILLNSERGIFGYYRDITGNKTAERRKAIPVADESEISLGKATLLCNVSGREVREYEVEICRVYREAETSRSLMISVTDPELLQRTGGIVQGMSGSPILQNGKLVGAVTHVLVNDPTRGYGVSVKKMLLMTECDEMRQAA